MAVKHTKLISELRRKVDEIDESSRVPGYHEDLWEALSQIVMLEREHKEAATQVQKKIADKVAALGASLYAQGWTGKGVAE